MSMFRALFFSALIAGIFTGGVTAVIDLNTTVPLILRAEAFEEAATRTASAEVKEATAEHHHHDEAASATPEYRRNGLTVVALVLAYTGFALVVVSTAEVFGRLASWRVGIIWGLAGFTVFSLAPAIGLPPELPAMPAAALGPRQLWWLCTALCTAIALGIVCRSRNPRAVVVAIALLAAPHVIGAPQPASDATSIPSDLYEQFVETTLVMSLLAWIVLGAVLGWVRPLFDEKPMPLRPFA